MIIFPVLLKLFARVEQSCPTQSSYRVLHRVRLILAPPASQWKAGSGTVHLIQINRNLLERKDIPIDIPVPEPRDRPMNRGQPTDHDPFFRQRTKILRLKQSTQTR